jgi:hypothetical protein
LLAERVRVACDERQPLTTAFSSERLHPNPIPEDGGSREENVPKHPARYKTRKEKPG